MFNVSPQKLVAARFHQGQTIHPRKLFKIRDALAADVMGQSLGRIQVEVFAEGVQGENECVMGLLGE